MANRRDGEDSNGATVGQDDYYTFFIDTSLGTHLATIISCSATVAEVKKKLVLEHYQLFPLMGEIKILSLQVKRQGYFYHLPDSMVVVSAYVGPNRHKSLFVEASTSEHDKEQDPGRRLTQELLSRDESTDTDKNVALFRDKSTHTDRNASEHDKEQLTLHRLTQHRLVYESTDTDNDKEHTTCHHCQRGAESIMKDENTNTDKIEGDFPQIENDKPNIEVEHVGAEVTKKDMILDSLVPCEVMEHVDSVGARRKKRKIEESSAEVQDKDISPLIEDGRSDLHSVEMTPATNVAVIAGSGANDFKSGSQRKKRKTKKSSAINQGYSCTEQTTAEHGLSSVADTPAKQVVEVMDEAMNVQMSLTQNVGEKESQRALVSEAVSVSVAQGEGEQVIQNQEVLLPPTDVHLNEETIGDKDENENVREVKINQRRNDSADANEKLVTGQPDDVLGPVLDQPGKHQENDRNVKKKRRKKRKKGHISAGEDLLNLEMKEQSSGVEGLEASGARAMEVGEKISESMNVSVSVPQRECKEVTQNQELLLPPADVYPEKENTGNLDENIREPEKLVIGQPNDVQGPVLDQQGKHQENDSSVNRKGRKKRKKGHSSARENLSNLEMREQSSGVEELVSSGTLTQEVGKIPSKSKDISVPVAWRQCEKVIQNQELLLPPTDVYPDQENSADMDGNAGEVVKDNQSRDDGRGANETLVTGKPYDVKDPVVDQLGRHQENGGSVNMKEEKRRKKKDTSHLTLKELADLAAGKNVNRNEEKKRKKGQTSAAESLSNLKLKELAELAASADVLKSMDSASETTKIKKSARGEHAVQSPDPHFQIEKNVGIELHSAKPESAQIGTSSSEVPLKGRPKTKNDGKSNLETAKGADGDINFRHYFVDRSSVKVKEALESVKPNRKEDKSNDIAESTLKLSETPGKGKPSDATKANDQNHEESTDEQKKELLENKNVSKASKDGAVTPTSSDVAGSRTLEKAMKSAISRNAKGNEKAAPLSLEDTNGSSTVPCLSSRFKGPRKVVQIASIAKQQSTFNQNAISTGKDSSSRNGNLLKSSGREKSLLTAERKLFSRSVSSSDSDSSTKTPAENSSSSGSSTGGSDSTLNSGSSSTGENDSSQDPKQNGPENTKTKGGAAKSVSSKKFSAQHMSMGMVLRSSSRFKKAKLTASQSQDVDTDEFVPDSKANA